jgi:ubiquinone/menaquinone biosynthesis C-methylase UbiE
MGYTAFDRFVARQRFRAAMPHLKPQSRVCDVACGLNADFLDFVADRIASGTGLDDQVAENGGGRWRYIRTDITKPFPLEDSSFDHVVMLAALEHLPQPEPVLRETFRVLAPGGSLIMTWPQPLVDPILGVLHKMRLVSDEMESQEHQRRVPLPRLLATLRQIGFSDFVHTRFELGMNNLLVASRATGQDHA